MIVFDTPLVWENGLESIIFGQTVVFRAFQGLHEQIIVHLCQKVDSHLPVVRLCL